MAMRRELVFGSPYQWVYEEYLMSLCFEADENAGRDVPACWTRIEDWRVDRRKDVGLRKRLLGY